METSLCGQQTFYLYPTLILITALECKLILRITWQKPRWWLSKLPYYILILKVLILFHKFYFFSTQLDGFQSLEILGEQSYSREKMSEIFFFASPLSSSFKLHNVFWSKNIVHNLSTSDKIWDKNQGWDYNNINCFTFPGERRIRVHTIALPVTSKLSDIYAYADQEAIVNTLSKLGKNTRPRKLQLAL